MFWLKNQVTYPFTVSDTKSSIDVSFFATAEISPSSIRQSISPKEIKTLELSGRLSKFAFVIALNSLFSCSLHKQTDLQTDNLSVAIKEGSHCLSPVRSEDFGGIIWFSGVCELDKHTISLTCALWEKIRFVRVANRKENTEDRVRTVWSLSSPYKIFKASQYTKSKVYSTLFFLKNKHQKK